MCEIGIWLLMFEGPPLLAVSRAWYIRHFVADKAPYVSSSVYNSTPAFFFERLFSLLHAHSHGMFHKNVADLGRSLLYPACSEFPHTRCLRRESQLLSVAATTNGDLVYFCVMRASSVSYLKTSLSTTLGSSEEANLQRAKILDFYLNNYPATHLVLSHTSI